MKRLIIAVLAASSAAIVTAQADTQDQKGRNSEFRAEMRTLIDGDGMKVEDLANLMQARAQARFKALDADGNGIVTKDEYTTATAERAQNRFERMKPDENGLVKRAGRDGPRHAMRDGKPNAERQEKRLTDQFARFDADSDGSISREEFDTAMKARTERFAERGKGRTGRHGGMPAEMRAMMRDGMNLESFTGMMQQRGTARFEALDADNNGELTAAEFTAKTAERAQHAFSRMDRDDNGVVTKDDHSRHGGKHHGSRSRD